MVVNNNISGLFLLKKEKVDFYVELVCFFFLRNNLLNYLYNICASIV